MHYGMNKKITITKASGQKAIFSEEQLRRSLSRSGADEGTIDKVLTQIEQQIYEGMPTHKIHKLAFKLLKKASRHYAAKYKLKQAIMELGPSGFPFEIYIAAILQHKGYEVKVDQIIKGHCVNHEVDIVAQQGKDLFMVECKYHNHTGIICDVKIPLYIKARFDDIAQQERESPGTSKVFTKGWLVTNTRFSKDALDYGLCSGLNLVGWDFPRRESLKEMIDSSGLHPVTCLTTLNSKEKQRLLDEKIVLCKDLLEDRHALLQMNINPNRLENILREASTLCR